MPEAVGLKTTLTLSPTPLMFDILTVKSFVFEALALPKPPPNSYKLTSDLLIGNGIVTIVSVFEAMFHSSHSSLLLLAVACRSALAACSRQSKCEAKSDLFSIRSALRSLFSLVWEIRCV